MKGCFSPVNAAATIKLQSLKYGNRCNAGYDDISSKITSFLVCSATTDSWADVPMLSTTQRDIHSIMNHYNPEFWLASQPWNIRYAAKSKQWMAKLFPQHIKHSFFYIAQEICEIIIAIKLLSLSLSFDFKFLVVNSNCFSIFARKLNLVEFHMLINGLSWNQSCVF